MRGKWEWGIAALGIALLAAVFVLFKSGPSPAGSRATTSAPSESPKNSGEKSPLAAEPSQVPLDPKRVTTLEPDANGRVVWPGAAAAADAINQPGQSAREDIAAVHTVLGDYRSVFGEVPEGGLNEEITRGLRGENPKKIIFLVEKPGMLDADGALLDRWGTPYFFHKLSGKLIDLRSAGPDRKFWTKDDIFDASTGGPPL
ncbi:MAG: hypothetical protein ACREKL_16480 [Chthoniobacterales bacterium]